MKGLIVILLALLLLGGGAAGGYLFFLAPDAATAEERPSKPPTPGALAELDPVTLPVIRSGKVAKLVTFRIALELAPGRHVNDITPDMPRLRDAVLTQLAGLIALDWPGGATVDMDVAKHRLLARTRQIVGKDIVAAILLRDLLERAG